MRKKFGSFFEGILDKSPDLAIQLKKMAGVENVESANKPYTEKNNNAQPHKTHSDTTSPIKPRQQVDRMQGVVVEKRSILPRDRPKPKKDKRVPLVPNSTAKSHFPEQANHKNQKKATLQSGSSGEFFEGIPNNVHQFGLNDRSSRLDIIIGFDFGTSSTKVVIHAPGLPGKPGYAVPFGDFAHQSLQYLLPTRLSIAQDGSCSLDASLGGTIVTEIKIGLMQSPWRNVKISSGPEYEADATVVATAYLALTLRYVRGWFIKNKRDVFGGYRLNWSCNLGLPAAIDDDEKLRNTFNMVGKAAWLASRRSDPITIHTAHKALEDLRNSKFQEDEMPWDFYLCPEVIAEVTGYARSQYRNEGLHLLVDIGASTMDVCSFILHKKDELDDYSILTADVGLLGAKILHHSRIISAEKSISHHAEKLFDIDDPLSVIPETAGDYVPSEDDITELVRIADAIFKEDCKILMSQTLADVRHNRFPESPRWSETFPIFVCGGASGMPLYQEVVTGIDEWLLLHVSSSQGARRIPLPKPVSLDAEISDEQYHRLAVAWGLSLESFNLGTYSRPSEIEDIPKPVYRDIADAFISKDMV